MPCLLVATIAALIVAFGVPGINAVDRETDVSAAPDVSAALDVSAAQSALASSAVPVLEPVVRDSTQVALDEQRTLSQFGSSWEFDYYVNGAYECGLSGNYSFMVVNPAGDPDAEAPLWVYLHGGGVGYFDADGEYVAINGQDEHSWNHQETFDGLIGIVEEKVLAGNGQLEDQTLVRRIEEGYRVLVVSYCDHDQYSGLGTPYPNHPMNPAAEVNGLQATMAAIDYTAANYPTTHVWVHGTSAGSAGAWAVGSSYGHEGAALTGVIVDSSNTGPQKIILGNTLKGTDGFPAGADFDSQGVTDKIGLFADLDQFVHPEAQVAHRDFRSVPVLFVYGLADPFCGGTLPPIPEAVAAGSGNCEYLWIDHAAAIDDQAESPHEVHAVPGAGHVPTNDPGPANDLVDGFIERVLGGDPPNFRAG